MTPSPRVVLFDIDGTLISTRGAGRRSMKRAFQAVIGSARALEGFAFSGMTDRAIIRRGLVEADAVVTHDVMEDVVASYLEELAVEMKSADVLVLPGVEALLSALAADRHVALGLGTGNLEPGARLKLSAPDLFRFFAFGGFGSDAEDRAALLRIGARRGAQALGHPEPDCRIIVVGDTPKDVAAARAIGSECIAVASGDYGAEELAACGATLVVSDLTSAQVFSTLGLEPPVRAEQALGSAQSKRS